MVIPESTSGSLALVVLPLAAYALDVLDDLFQPVIPVHYDSLDCIFTELYLASRKGNLQHTCPWL